MPIDSLMNEGSLFYFRYIFFGMGVWYLLDNNPHISTCLMYVSIISILAVSADALFQYFNGLNLLGNSKPNPHRLTGLFGHEPIVGRYIAYLSLFTFALIYQNFKRSKKIIIFSVSFLVVTEIVVFLSGERAPLFYLILFSVFLFIFNPNYRVYRLLGLLVSIFIIYGIFFINSNAKTRVIDLTIKQLNQTHFPFLPYSDHHEEHYISGLKMFIDKPLFGIGTNLFRNKCEYKIYIHKERSCNTHPHHYYIQTLAELGIFGFSFILIFFLYLSFNLLKQFFYYIRSNTHKKIPFEYLQFHILLFIFWWPIIPHMSLYNNWNNVLMMLPLGYFMKYLYESRINGNTS
jgi:O-antigen ligase